MFATGKQVATVPMFTFEIYRKTVKQGTFLVQTENVKEYEMEFACQTEANQFCEMLYGKGKAYAVPKW